MRLVWAVLASDSSIDKDTNQVSLFNVIEGISIVSEKELTPGHANAKCQLVLVWERSVIGTPETGEMTVQFRYQGEALEVTGSPKIPVNLMDSDRHRVTMRIESLPIGGAGHHLIDIVNPQDNSVLASISYEVQHKLPASSEES